MIPARGGSKGIPKKNIKDFAGRPLIAYTIDVARQIADDAHIILSTDSDEIAEVAEALGLKVEYRRPPELATDCSGSREVVIDAMDYADSKGVGYDCVVLLQPTAPMRTAEDVAGAMALYDGHRVDMVVSVIDARTNPYYNCFEQDEATGYLKISKGDGLLTRRQDAPPAWEYNGAVYVINPDSIRRMALGAFPRRVPYPMPVERSIDLDTPKDWAIGEILMKGVK